MPTAYTTTGGICIHRNGNGVSHLGNLDAHSVLMSTLRIDSDSANLKISERSKRNGKHLSTRLASPLKRGPF